MIFDAYEIKNHRVSPVRGCPEDQRKNMPCCFSGLVRCPRCLTMVCSGAGGMDRHRAQSRHAKHVIDRNREGMSAAV